MCCKYFTNWLPTMKAKVMRLIRMFRLLRTTVEADDKVRVARREEKISTECITKKTQKRKYYNKYSFSYLYC